MKITDLTVVKSTEIDMILSYLKEIKENINKINLPIKDEILYSGKEVQRLLNISAKTLQNRRNNGDIGYVKSGAKIYYRRIDIEVYINKNFQEPFK